MTDVDHSNSGNISWTPSIELLLVSWCDQSKCFEWMHTESYSYFDSRGRTMMILTNVIIALSGLTNVITGGTTINGFNLSWTFGSLSILVSITNMLQEKLAYVTRATKHLEYSIQWGTIRRKIDEVVSIPPENRIDCNTFMKYLRQDINQVSVNGNTSIPEFIRDNCYSKFNKIENFDIPDICGDVEHTHGYNINIHPILDPLISNKGQIQDVPNHYIPEHTSASTLVP